MKQEEAKKAVDKFVEKLSSTDSEDQWELIDDFFEKSEGIRDRQGDDKYHGKEEHDYTAASDSASRILLQRLDLWRCRFCPSVLVERYIRHNDVVDRVLFWGHDRTHPHYGVGGVSYRLRRRVCQGAEKRIVIRLLNLDL